MYDFRAKVECGVVQSLPLLSRYSYFLSLFWIIPEGCYVVEDYIDSTLRCRLFEYCICIIYICRVMNWVSECFFPLLKFRRSVCED